MPTEEDAATCKAKMGQLGWNRTTCDTGQPVAGFMPAHLNLGS